ncbi:ScbA/BarX family gamma-butyrolactone biosynthesis protein [Arthrobacter sp. ERGS1:01]|uniref:ScbA/BarX family gamma-butyrolactone biosynthesis protein n=1 Tax=Arthrobacter sp. ERGS1:01 TaxID=1704044 RepID=UPI0006B63235|nr:ScbA/BarX family gamma-butyrolactone biosynthesis protein [Arthrobacter sp. ERGS1:01]
MELSDQRGPGWEPGPNGLSFSTSMPRELVHRRAISEVFITDMADAGGSRVLVGAQWPRWHVFYGAGPAGVDSALMAETLRQAVIVFAHRRGVPLTHQFLMPHMAISLAAAELDPRSPAEIVLELDLLRFSGPPVNPTGLLMAARFLSAGKELGRGEASARILGAAAYDRYRAQRPTESDAGSSVPLDPLQVGHESIRNVVLAAGARPLSWALRVDQAHPIFFDHPLDHVPGMLLVEAARQALRVASGIPHADFASFNAEFRSLVELAHAVEVSASLEGNGTESGSAGVRISRGGRVLMSLTGALKVRT